MKQWFMMGGYALYVWPTYLLMVAAITGLVMHVNRAMRHSKQSLHITSSTHDASSS